MDEQPDREPDVDIDLTAEQQVAADAAMLLDLGGAEELADAIARQSGGERGPAADAPPVDSEG